MTDRSSTLILHQKDKPLFPELLWSRPENKKYAGKLLIIGGNLHDIANISLVAQLATKAGAGAVRIILPDFASKIVGISENIFYSPSTKSGSFARESLGDWLEHAIWADMVLLPGELGRNSQTAIALEQFIQKFNGPLTITRDGIDLLESNTEILFNRPLTNIVATIPQLQKLIPKPYGVLTHSISLSQAAAVLSPASAPDRRIITSLHNQLIVAANGQISVTSQTEEHWRLPKSTQVAVWSMQLPKSPFEAITTAVL